MREVTSSTLLMRLAEVYSLRKVDQYPRYLGSCEGLGLDFSNSGDDLLLHFLSPSIEIRDHQLNQFEEFSHLKQVGVPPEWLRGNTSETALGSRVLEKHVCTLELDRARLELLSEEQLVAIPKAVATDFQQLGAPPQLPPCSLCGADNPRELYCAGNVYHYACTGCLKDLQLQTSGGSLMNTTPIDWPRAAAALVCGSALFGAGWGWLQQMGRVTEEALLVGPFAGALFFAKFVARSAGGASLLLRVLTLVATVCSVFGGNVWSVKAAALRQGFDLSWTAAIEFYFTQYLPNSETSGWYLLGGLGGAWFGSRFLKMQSNIKID